MAHQPRDEVRNDSTLVPMLIWGLVLIVIGMGFVMMFE